MRWWWHDTGDRVEGLFKCVGWTSDRKMKKRRQQQKQQQLWRRGWLGKTTTFRRKQAATSGCRKQLIFFFFLILILLPWLFLFLVFFPCFSLFFSYIYINMYICWKPLHCCCGCHWSIFLFIVIQQTLFAKGKRKIKPKEERRKNPQSWKQKQLSCSLYLLAHLTFKQEGLNSCNVTEINSNTV